MQRTPQNRFARAIVLALLLLTAATQAPMTSAVAQAVPAPAAKEEARLQSTSPGSPKGTGTAPTASPGPANDNFAAPQVVAGPSVSVGGTNAGATTEPNEPNHANAVSQASVWYSWIAPESGPAVFNTAQAEFDTVLAVYTGSSLAALIEVASSDDFGGSLRSKATFTASAGTQYRIAVAGFGVARGNFVLQWSVNRPSNDDFANATALSGASGSRSGTNDRATGEPGEPSHHGLAMSDASVWFSWAPPRRGLASIRLTGPVGTLRPAFGIYTGSDYGSLESIRSHGSPIAQTFAVVPGTTYRIAVEGESSTTGSFQIIWRVEVARTADFDADGASDVSVFRPATGVWYANSSAVPFGANGDIPVPGDYDGDADADQAVFRPSNGVWYTNASPAASVPFGTSTDIPVPADYNGDGKTDIAVFRPANGVWYIQNPASSTPFGTSGDIPVPGDYNGDGKAEPAVFRPSTGTWYLSGPPAASPAFGANGDIPVPGDYDGDGKTDIAVYRPSNKVWYIGGTSPSSVLFGAAGDQPQPADYNGDGKTDIAVFRPSNQVWYAFGPAAMSVAFGSTNDIPLPLPNAIRRFFF